MFHLSIHLYSRVLYTSRMDVTSVAESRSNLSQVLAIVSDFLANSKAIVKYLCSKATNYSTVTNPQVGPSLVHIPHLLLSC